MSTDSHIGGTSGPSEVSLAETPRQEAAQPVVGFSAASGGFLYEYQTDGRIGGVPVSSCDRGLPIESDEALADAFELRRRPRALVVSLPADAGDVSGKYAELLEAVYDGRAVVIDERTEWDAASSRFVVFVRYDEVEYALRSRFSYLREEGR